MTWASDTAWQEHRPLLLPVLALWGWQTDFLIPALALGIVLELPRLVPARLAISQADFDRLWSFSSVLFLGTVFYLALARQGLDAVGALSGAPPVAGEPDSMHRVSGTALTFLRWLPFILAPFTCAVAWSRRLALPWSTFSLYEQARAKRQPHVPPPEWASRPMHPGYLYLGVTAFAAGTTTAHPDAFLSLLLAVLLVALWPWRNPRWGVVTWLVVVLALGTVATFGKRSHQITRAAWAAVEDRLLQSGNGNYGSFANPSQVSRATALGQIGKIKQSSAVILRVVTSDEQAPGLLREASFNRFRRQNWDNGHRTFTTVEPQPLPPGAATMTVTRASGGGDCPLAIPSDLGGLQPPAVGILEAGGLGSLRIRGGLPLVICTAARHGTPQLDEPPEADDLGLDLQTPDERRVLAGIVAELGLQGQPAPTAAMRLEQWFATKFTYEIYQARRPEGESPVAQFLTVTHAGHCEYFATATVLLLRAAGIPARYALGYSVSERAGVSGLGGDRWLGRGRDAHAWALVWDGTRWADLDTTPASWPLAERAATSWFAGLRDLWDEGWHRFTLWRQEGGSWQLAVFIVGMLILAWIGWRQLRGSAWRRAVPTKAEDDVPTILGLDSECIALFAGIAHRHGARHAAETPRAWLARLGLLDGSPRANDLATALALHQRLRFDPHGLALEERRHLKVCVAALAPQLAGAPLAGRADLRRHD